MSTVPISFTVYPYRLPLQADNDVKAVEPAASIDKPKKPSSAKRRENRDIPTASSAPHAKPEASARRPSSSRKPLVVPPPEPEDEYNYEDDFEDYEDDFEEDEDEAKQNGIVERKQVRA